MKQVLSVDRLAKYLLQRAPVRDIFAEYSVPTSYDEQLSLGPHLNAIAQHNGYYLRMFLQRYLHEVETHAGGDIDDTIYEIMAGLLGAKELDPTEYDYLTYPIAEESTIVIRENPRIISGANTTGFRTWEAAVCLSLILNNDLLQEKFGSNKLTIVELGCGTGLVSLLLLKRHQKSPFLKDIYITDGSVELVENVNSTLTLNAIDARASHIHLHQLLWGDSTTSAETYRSTDILVGADITYDSSVLPHLIAEMKCFFSNTEQPHAQAIIAATVRNEDTIDAWESHLEEQFSGKWTMTRPDLYDTEFLGDVYIKNKTWPINIYHISTTTTPI